MKSKKLSKVQKQNLKYLKNKLEDIEEDIKNTEISNVENIKSLLIKWIDVNLVLQDVLGFESDVKMIPYWRIPHCTCPKIDNEDNYPEQRYFNTECPLHYILRKDVNPFSFFI